MHSIPLWCWFLVGAATVGGAQAVHLGTRGWNVTAFLQVGEQSPARERIARDFPDLALAPQLGHDGKYSYLVAREPAFWLTDAAAREHLQDPAYRYSRPLYPLLAGLGGTLSPRGTLAGLLLVQVLAGGICGLALAASARSQRLPPAFAALNLLNPGLASSACLLTSDLLAHALSLGAWHSAAAGRRRTALGLFALALLAKEYYALTPLALACSFAIERRGRAAFAFGVLPLVPILLWKLAVTAALGVGEGQGNFTWPGGGIGAAAPKWSTAYAPAGALAIAVVLGCFIASVTPRLPAQLRWPCAAWGFLGLCTSELVWGDASDLLRALTPAWWFVSLAAFAALRRFRHPSS